MLKLDPKNTELLSQKQDVLNRNIETTGEKLKELQKIKEEADKQMANGTKVSEENYRALQREIINTQNKLSDLKNEASNWTKVGRSLTELGTNLENVGKTISSLGDKLTTSLTVPIAAIAAAGVTYDAQIEKYETAFKTFLGSAEAAQKAIKNLKEDAKRTPFDTTSIVRANQMLISTGVSAEDAREDILALGEAVIATGGGNDELVRMASNLQQIKNAGKATAMDIRQFAYAGIDVYGILADQMGTTTDKIKGMDISFEDLTKALKKASSQGGKYFGAMANSSKTLTGQVSALKSETQEMLGELTKSLMPVAKKLIEQARKLIKQFDNLDDSQKENIVKLGLMVAAAGPLLKIFGAMTTTVGGLAKGIGTFSKAISLAHNGIGTATGSAATLAKVLQGLTSPLGIAAVGATAAITAIVVAIRNAEKDTVEAFSNIGKGASDFVTGIDTANSHLDAFNKELFVSSEEQQKLQEEMDKVQQGITKICETAAKERRELNEKEIAKFDEYFRKLRELNAREVEFQKQISVAIAQQAKTNAESFEGSLSEYKVQSQEWLKTAQDQKERTLELIEEQTIQEIALLNMRFTTEEQKQTEAYQTEYQSIMEQKKKKIEEATDEVAQIYEVYANGYSERVKQQDGFFTQLEEANQKQEAENERHEAKLKEINENTLWDESNKNSKILFENKLHLGSMQKIWKETYKDMSDEQEKELGVWLAMLAQTELYGGEISEENQNMVNAILESYDSMPKKTKEAMKNAMQPMLEEMQKKEPSLYAKAANIAEGILNRLKKSFDIHSPSKKTREIFENVMKGAELGLEDEEKRLNKEVDSIAKDMNTKLASIMPNMGNLKQSVIDNTKTIFTTPQIVFNVQELDDEKLQQCFNYINRRFGSAY